MAQQHDPIESVRYEHTSEPMTIGRLRDIIDGLPDDVPVLMTYPHEPGADSPASTIFAVSALTRPTLYGLGTSVVIEGSFPPGTYERARRVRLRVTGLPLGDEGQEATAVLLDAVDAQVRSSGHRGSFGAAIDADTGTITWSWTADNLPLDDLVRAVRQTIDTQNPGSWLIDASDA